MKHKTLYNGEIKNIAAKPFYDLNNGKISGNRKPGIMTWQMLIDTPGSGNPLGSNKEVWRQNTITYRIKYAIDIFKEFGYNYDPRDSIDPIYVFVMSDMLMVRLDTLFKKWWDLGQYAANLINEKITDPESGETEYSLVDLRVIFRSEFKVYQLRSAAIQYEKKGLGSYGITAYQNVSLPHGVDTNGFLNEWKGTLNWKHYIYSGESKIIQSDTYDVSL